MRNLSSLVLAALVLAAVSIAPAAHALSIGVYLSSPGTQGTIFSDTSVETFSSLTAGQNQITPFAFNGNASIGTYQTSATNRFAVIADNMYGSGTGNYVSLGAQSTSSAPVTLQFVNQQAYFGFSWNAGDVNNGIGFYNNSTLIGHYSTGAIISLLSGSTIQSINGTSYNTSQYKGKPGAPTMNPGENYAFINFIFNGGTFNRIVFDNNNTTGTGFESDNHTVRTTPVNPDGTFVFVNNVVVPEPSALPLTLIGLAPLGLLARRLRRA